MNWTERIIDATGWHAEPAGEDKAGPGLGVPLPADYLKLCRHFGPGAFSAYLSVLQPAELVETWSSYRSHSRMSERFLAPHGLYQPGRGPGLIPWASDQTDGEYFWLADASVAPDRWPVIARNDSLESSHRFEMSTTEFVFRVIADPEFQPFTVADPPRLAFFLPLGQTISSAAEWEALTRPDRRR